MNPFIYSEFWLSFAFLLVIGLVIFSPIRQKIHHFTKQQQQSIQDKIDTSNTIYKEAQKAYQETLKKSKIKWKDSSLTTKMKALKQEFFQKEQAQITTKTQDFQTRQNLILSQTKNNLRMHLLDRVEKKILKTRSSKKGKQEIEHFIIALHENQQKLNDSLKNAV